MSTAVRTTSKTIPLSSRCGSSKRPRQGRHVDRGRSALHPYGRAAPTSTARIRPGTDLAFYGGLYQLHPRRHDLWFQQASTSLQLHQRRLPAATPTTSSTPITGLFSRLGSGNASATTMHSLALRRSSHEAVWDTSEGAAYAWVNAARARRSSPRLTSTGPQARHDPSGPARASLSSSRSVTMPATRPTLVTRVICGMDPGRPEAGLGGLTPPPAEPGKAGYHPLRPRSDAAHLRRPELPAPCASSSCCSATSACPAAA